MDMNSVSSHSQTFTDAILPLLDHSNETSSKSMIKDLTFQKSILKFSTFQVAVIDLELITTVSTHVKISTPTICISYFFF